MSENGFKSRVLVTGRLWLGAGGAMSIGTALSDLISSTKQELLVVAYRISAAAPEFSDGLERCLSRGCQVTIILDRSELPNDAESALLARLTKNYRNLSVFTFRDAVPGAHNVALHAKMLVVDRSRAIVGSANFSKNGMVENHELGIMVGAEEALKLGEAVDALLRNGKKEGVLTELNSDTP